MKGTKNLFPGAGTKKIKDIEDIWNFKTKYKATERTKNMILKHAKEAAENLLKVNNTKVDGLDKGNNGFVLLYKTGNKAFMVCEGDMGKIMLENKEYRNDTFNNASMVEVKFNTPILTSLLKGQYGKSDDKNTPRGQKR